MTLEQAVDVLNASKYHRAVYRISRPGWVTGRVVGESYDASVMPADAAIAVAEKLAAKPSPSPDLSVLRERIVELAGEYVVGASYGRDRDLGAHEAIEQILALLDDEKAGEGK